MKRIYFIIIFLINSNYICVAQSEVNIWYFGQKAGLDFNSGNPTPLLDGELDTFEGCSTISDFNGNLLFYSDGITVWNRNHLVMPNGIGLSGNSSSTQSALIVPKPNDNNIYYIFTVDADGGSNGLQYSEVNMSLDSGLGDITANKNIVLHTPVTEKITAVESLNGNEFWVVSHKWQSSEFIAYKVSDMGVNTTPVISNTGPYIGNSGLTESRGQIKISPDGTKLAVVRVSGSYEAQLFDFNAASGVVSNPVTLINFEPDQQNVYGVEFSNNSNLLYVSIYNNGIYQFNLQAGSNTDIINSMLMVSAQPSEYAGLQLASDGKIYVAKFQGFYIDVIENPNILGAGCNYQFQSLYLNGRISRFGLPPFIQSYFAAFITVNNNCFGAPTNFTINSSENIDSITWDFGDTNTSNLENPTHIYNAPGNYTVTATVTSGTITTTNSKDITIHEVPIANTPQNLNQCDDENNQDSIADFDLTEQYTSILLGQSPNLNQVSFHLTQADADTNSNPLSTSYSNIENPQTIYVRVENTYSSDCYDTTSFEIMVQETPSLQMETNWVICANEALTISADAGYDAYLWSTGETTRSISVNEAGNYSVTVGNQYGNLICDTSLNITVTASNIATINDIEVVDWTLNDNMISVSVEGSGDYEYSIDGFAYQDNPVFLNLSIDDYTVYVRDKNGCGVVTREIYLLHYPRFFTPNGDRENERWQIINSQKEPNNRLSIYDRYGKLITTINPNDSGWDGTYNGRLMPSTDYWFVLERQNGKVYTGHFSLVR